MMKSDIRNFVLRAGAAASKRPLVTTEPKGTNLGFASRLPICFCCQAGGPRAGFTLLAAWRSTSNLRFGDNPTGTPGPLRFKNWKRALACHRQRRLSSSFYSGGRSCTHRVRTL